MKSTRTDQEHAQTDSELTALELATEPTSKQQVSRRGFMKGVAAGATVLTTAGILAACTTATDIATSGESSEALSPTAVPSADTASNFNVMPDSKTKVGTTYENIMSAMTGETGATTKYAACAKVADQDDFAQVGRLFSAASAAEAIHIELLYELASKMDPDTKKPEPPSVTTHQSDVNLIAAATGEIYETSDMYPAFIKAAQKENESDAILVFTHAKLAEGYHAEHYLNAYNNIDTPDDDKYYVCPVCGYIHKGEAFTACPICLTKKSAFKEY